VKDWTKKVDDFFNHEGAHLLKELKEKWGQVEIKSTHKELRTVWK